MQDVVTAIRHGRTLETLAALHEVRGDGPAQFLAGPEEVSATARSTFLFVGGRFVRDRSLLHALALGYGPLLEKGRYPLAALFLDLPGREVELIVEYRGASFGRFVMVPTPGAPVAAERLLVAAFIADQVGAALAVQARSA